MFEQTSVQGVYHLEGRMVCEVHIIVLIITMRGATKKYIYPTVPPEVYDYNLLEMLAACSFVSAAVRSIASSTFDIAPIDIPACICTLS